MSKVQVDTIVDKDDISAPTLSKGAIVTGVCTATTFVGAVTGDVTGNVTGNADTATTASSATSATTATTATNAQGLTGTPSITVTDVGANDVNATGVGTFGSVVSGAISGSTGTFTGDIDIAENIIHTGDTDTKIHFSAADQISFVTGGTTRLNITSGGNLEMPNDSDYIKIGASGDLQLVHTGGVSYISDSGSPLEIRTDTLKIASGVGTEAFRVGGDGQLGVAGANYGTSGQVLTSAGSAASPSWADVSAGIWSTLASGTVTSGTTGTITDDGISSSYDMYKIVFQCVSSSYIGMGVDITTDGGSTWSSDTTGWTYSLIGRDSNTNWASDGSGQSAGFFIGGNSKHRFWGEITFNDTQNTATNPSFNFVGGVGDNATNHCGTIMSNVVWPTATAFNGVRWYSAHAAMTNVKWVLLGTTLS